MQLRWDESRIQTAPATRGSSVDRNDQITVTGTLMWAVHDKLQNCCHWWRWCRWRYIKIWVLNTLVWLPYVWTTCTTTGEDAAKHFPNCILHFVSSALGCTAKQWWFWHFRWPSCSYQHPAHRQIKTCLDVRLFDLISMLVNLCS